MICTTTSMIFIANISADQVELFCNEDFTNMYFGSNFENSIYIPSNIDSLLNAPSSLLCTELCPCVEQREFMYTANSWPAYFLIN